MNQNENQEKLDENFSSEPLVKKPRRTPRKNLLTNLKNIPSQPKRKRGRPRKQIYEDILPEIYAQKSSRTKVESDSNWSWLFRLFETNSSKKEKKKNTKKPRNITEFESEESENYFSTSEDEINDIETSHEGNDGENYEENFEQYFEENIEDNLEENFGEKFEENHEENLEEEFEERHFEENLKLNQLYQINSEKDDNNHNDDNRSPPEPPPTNSKSTRKMLINENIVDCRDQLTMQKIIMHNLLQQMEPLSITDQKP